MDILELNMLSLRLFLPELIIIGAMLVIIVSDLIWQRRAWLAAGLGIAAMVTSAAVVVLTAPVGERYLLFVGMLSYDMFAAFFKLIAAIAVVFSIIISLKSEEVRREGFAEYVVMMLGMALGMNVLAMSANLLAMFLAFELVSMTSYILTSHLKENRASSEAALKYAIYSGASAGIMLYGMSLLFGLTGSLSVWHIAEAFAGSGPSLAVAVATLFILAGIGYKIASVPFHFWCPDAYEGAPTPVAALLSVGPKAAGMAMLARFLYEALAIPFGETIQWHPVGLADWQIVVAGISAATMTLGNFAAIWQENMKRLLAYSSIAHAGYLLMGVAMISPLGMKAVMFYLAVYLFMNLGAFLVIIALAGVDEERSPLRLGGPRQPRTVRRRRHGDLPHRARRTPADGRVHRQVLPLLRRAGAFRPRLAGRRRGAEHGRRALLLRARDPADVPRPGARGRTGDRDLEDEHGAPRRAAHPDDRLRHLLAAPVELRQLRGSAVEG